MPLTTNVHSSIDSTSLDCIKFSMIDPTGMLVLCVVTGQALRDLADNPGDDLKAIFKARRKIIEEKASNKLDETGTDGKREVIVTNSD